MPRYLTKSRLKLAIECPTKLFYTRKELYPDKSATDPFLMALAEGGFQVGELAKLYYPGGVDITTLEYEQSIEETQDLLKKENVVIFEAAFKYLNLFIRADIVEKNGNKVNLIEVKSKSFDGDDSAFIGKRSESITPGWKPYLFDVAFQKHVLQKAHPEFEITSFLMLADKTAVTTVDGLNQKFQLLKADNDRTYCKVVGNVTPSDLGDEILIRENVDEVVSMIHRGEEKARFQETGFEEWVNMLSDYYTRNVKINIAVHKDCGKCQFTCTSEEEMAGKKSGFKECWEAKTPLSTKDLEKPLIFELWRGSMGGKDTLTNLLDDNIWFLKDIQETYYAPNSGKQYLNLSPTERRTLQIQKCKTKDKSPYVDTDGLKVEMSNWKFPLHFIDFETSMVAIPFTKGRRPYEGIAFQFSHHTAEQDGTITHVGQYLDTEQGKFPNFDFMRALKKELEGDNGTIFRYAAHENTYLNMIFNQLGSVSDQAAPDRHVLREFIKTITKSTGNSVEIWEGDRNMVDMLEIVKSFHYDPAMKGSNSIKVVLPAVLNASAFLQQKYSFPICGRGKQVSSLNFEDKVWVEWEDGKVKNPYNLLDPIFEGLSSEEMDKFITDEKIADGGAAMTAYARMQFTSMNDIEKERIVQGLYRYCELDTLAMVFIWEYWMSLE